jgi:competence protein ComEA
VGPVTPSILTALLVIVALATGGVTLLPRLLAAPVQGDHLTPDLTVHVVGEVAVPGTYTLPWGARVADLVDAAGGLTAEADVGLVERSARLTDGRTVVVPSRRSPDGDGRVDVNTASERLLTTLPGVGPATAARIIAARPFHRIDDLLRVRGIGPRRLEALRPRVTL